MNVLYLNVNKWNTLLLPKWVTKTWGLNKTYAVNVLCEAGKLLYCYLYLLLSFLKSWNLKYKFAEIFKWLNTVFLILFYG